MGGPVTGAGLLRPVQVIGVAGAGANQDRYGTVLLLSDAHCYTGAIGYTPLASRWYDKISTEEYDMADNERRSFIVPGLIILVIALGVLVWQPFQPDHEHTHDHHHHDHVGADDVPEPWEYDPELDRYWNPAHGHWHPGEPPAGAATSSEE